MRTCPQCHAKTEAARCERDGTATIVAGAPQAPRRVDGRLGLELDGIYVVEKWIGSGSFGSVYRGRHKTLGTEVAIKFLKRTDDEDDRGARFKREALITSRLKHSNTVKTLHFGEASNGQFYIVMEFLEGAQLASILGRGGLDSGRTIHILQQILLSLAEAHAAGIVHRDVKPQNVMLMQRPLEPDFVKVLDFGLAKPMQGSHSLQHMAAGTPEYMAPEQSLGHAVDGRTDLYAVGCIAYSMLAGQLPFQRSPHEPDAAMPVILAHINNPPTPLGQLVPGCPKPLATLVDQLLAKSPDARPLNAEVVIRRLRSLASTSAWAPELQTSLARLGRGNEAPLPSVPPPLPQPVLPKERAPRAPAEPPELPSAVFSAAAGRPTRPSSAPRTDGLAGTTDAEPTTGRVSLANVMPPAAAAGPSLLHRGWGRAAMLAMVLVLAGWALAKNQESVISQVESAPRLPIVSSGAAPMGSQNSRPAAGAAGGEAVDGLASVHTDTPASEDAPDEPAVDNRPAAPIVAEGLGDAEHAADPPQAKLARIHHSARIESEPSGATVRIGDTLIGETPVEVVWESDSPPPTVALSLRGFEPAAAPVPIEAAGSEFKLVLEQRRAPSGRPQRAPAPSAHKSAAPAARASGYVGLEQMGSPP